MARPFSLRWRRPFTAGLCVALGVVGLLGAYRYWESYYQHRGFATVAYLPHAHRGRLETMHFYSPALHREADYIVYVPPGYGRGARRYPAYYLLHGSPGRPEVYLGIASMPVRMDNLIAQHRMGPMLLVMPDGRIGGSTYSDSEWANTPSGQFESYVLEVVRNVDERFRTLRSRRDRVIAGFSAGAYGATNVALHHLSTFAGLQSWSGYYVETHSGVFGQAAPSTLRANSPLDYVGRLRRQLALDPLRAFLFIGRDDDDSPQTAPMARALARAGAQVSYALYPGGHDWRLWHAHLDQMLELAWHDTAQPLTHGHIGARFLTPGVVPLPHGRGHRRLSPLVRQLLGPGGGRLLSPDKHGLFPVFGSGAGTGPGSGAGSGAGTGRGSRPALRRRPHARPPHARPGRTRRRHRVALVLTSFRTRRRGHVGPRGRGRIGQTTLLVGLLTAIVSAALINLGFLLQHRGLRDAHPGGLMPRLRWALGNRTWLSGQAIGWVGFGAQIVAVAIAPLALVQAFAAGGLALSVPLAAGVFGQRVTRGQLLAVLVMAASLAVLPLGFSHVRDRVDEAALVSTVVVASVIALALAPLAAAWIKAVAAGLLYGVADAAIKAISVHVHAHGAGAIVSGWTVLAAVATFGGFLAFQAALQSDGPVAAISLMTALAALTGLGCGLLAFGESLGSGLPIVIGHAVAIAAVLACVPALAAAQAAMADGDDPLPGSARAGSVPASLRSGR